MAHEYDRRGRQGHEHTFNGLGSDANGNTGEGQQGKASELANKAWQEMKRRGRVRGRLSLAHWCLGGRVFLWARVAMIAAASVLAQRVEWCGQERKALGVASDMTLSHTQQNWRGRGSSRAAPAGANTAGHCTSSWRQLRVLCIISYYWGQYSAISAGLPAPSFQWDEAAQAWQNSRSVVPFPPTQTRPNPCHP